VSRIFKCSSGTILNNLKKYSISRRKPGELTKGKNNWHWKGGKPLCPKCGKRLSYRKGKQCQKCYVKTMVGKNHPAWKDNKPKCIDCGKPHKDKNKKRCWKCHTIHNKGKDHPSWEGGKSFEPYTPEFNEPLKEEIRENWGRKCLFPNCDIPEQECTEKLSIHHIDYNKKNCSPVNLIPLCRKHNAMVNKNRKFWENYFTDLMISKIPEIIKNNKE
jgi:hypothetical protein